MSTYTEIVFLFFLFFFWGGRRECECLLVIEKENISMTSVSCNIGPGFDCNRAIYTQAGRSPLLAQLGLMPAGAFTYLQSGPNLNWSFGVIITSDVSCVCYPFRPQLRVPDSRWHTVEGKQRTALLWSWAEGSCFYPRIAKCERTILYSAQAQPGNICLCIYGPVLFWDILDSWTILTKFNWFCVRWLLGFCVLVL